MSSMRTHHNQTYEKYYRTNVKILDWRIFVAWALLHFCLIRHSQAFSGIILNRFKYVTNDKAAWIAVP